MTKSNDLQSMTREELEKLAKERSPNVAQSEMNKEELIKAIESHGK